MSPAAERYSAVTCPNRLSGMGFIMICLKPGVTGSAAMPATVSQIASIIMPTDVCVNGFGKPLPASQPIPPPLASSISL